MYVALAEVVVVMLYVAVSLVLHVVAHMVACSGYAVVRDSTQWSLLVGFIISWDKASEGVLESLESTNL